MIAGQKMEIERSLNGFYTVTFVNKTNLKVTEISELFSSVGEVCKIIDINRRIFVRFQHKNEAEKALEKFGKTHNVQMAIQRLNPGKTNGTASITNQETNTDNKDSKRLTLKSLEDHDSATSMNKWATGYHLILGNLPKNYTNKDVNGLVEEAKPLFVNQLQETRAFHIKFCHVVLESLESLMYLINKLDGFVICGEKLIAVEAKSLLEWRDENFLFKI